jgi:hypothetical protein
VLWVDGLKSIGEKDVQGAAKDFFLCVSEQPFQLLVDQNNGRSAINDHNPFGKRFQQGPNGDVTLEELCGKGNPSLNIEITFEFGGVFE